MKATKVVVIVAASAVGLTFAVAGLQAAQRAFPSGPVLAASELIHFRGDFRGGSGGRGMDRVCSDERDERLADAFGFIETFVAFTPDQVDPWEGLKDAVRNGSANVGEACATLQPLDEDASAPQRLAQMETMIATGLEIVREVRPAFDDLYAVLTDDQQQAIDGLANRHHGRR